MATYNGSDKRLGYLFQNGGGGGASALVDLSDVSISSPSDGQVLIYDSANAEWVNSSVGNPSSLASMSDVTLTNPTSGQVLTYNGSEWVNQTGGGSGHTYSTTEQVVGTWIDGKPIYEKTIYGQFASNVSDLTVSYDVSDLDRVIDLKGILIPTSGTGTIVIGAYSSIPLTFSSNTTTKCVINRNGGGNWGLTPEVYVTVQYTKSTD